MRVSSRPKARRYSPDTLTDRELLLLSILAMWRSDPSLLLMNYDKPEIEEWVPAATRLWDSPIDISVKISASTSFHLIGEALYQMIPSDDFFDGIATWVELASSVASFQPFDLLILNAYHNRPLTLLVIAKNLLQAKNDLELQRLWMGDTHGIIGLYTRKSEVIRWT